MCFTSFMAWKNQCMKHLQAIKLPQFGVFETAVYIYIYIYIMYISIIQRKHSNLKREHDDIVIHVGDARSDKPKCLCLKGLKGIRERESERGERERESERDGGR